MKKNIIIGLALLGLFLTSLTNSFAQLGCWKMVSASSYDHSLGIKTDGTLWGWGYNYFATLGDGTNIDKSSPIQIGTSNNWKTVSAGGSHTLAIKTDGTLWAWGSNSFGECGYGSTSIWSKVPMQVGTDTNWQSISTGEDFSLAIKSNGTLWAWGANLDGNLGDSTQINSYSPKQIGKDSNWILVTAGRFHSIALKKDGTLWGWGNNYSGATGVGASSGYYPKQIGTDNNWKYANACEHTLAIKTDGTLWAWGLNNDGQIGDSTKNSRLTPVQIGNATNWQFVSAGASRHSLAIKTDGTLWAWGSNKRGQLGFGDTAIKRITPTQVGSGIMWSSISAGSDNSAALRQDGTLWTWGYNNVGQLGIGTTGVTAGKWKPFMVNCPTSATSFSIIDINPYIATTGTTVTINGHFFTGASAVSFGGINAANFTVVNDSIITAIVATGASGYVSVTTANGTVSIAGFVYLNAPIINSFTPISAASGDVVTIKGMYFTKANAVSFGGTNAASFTIANDSTITAIVGKGTSGNITINTIPGTASLAGFTYLNKPYIRYFTPTTAVAGDRVLIKGYNFTGANNITFGNKPATNFTVLNDSTITAIVGNDSSGKVSVSIGGNTASMSGFIYPTGCWKQVLTGQYFTVGIKTDGTLWAWGSDLGKGLNYSEKRIPTQIGSANDWQTVSAGYSNCYVIKKDGTLWGWGDNSYSNLGDGTSVNKTLPVQIGSANDWQFINAGNLFTTAIKTDGTLWAWGVNNQGQIGDGTKVNKTVPVQIGTDKDWQSVSAGAIHTMAIKTNGTLWAWGNNGYGESGFADGDVINRVEPTQVSTSMWKQVYAANTYTTGIQADGTLWTWGYNSFGQLGDGTTLTRNSPIKISNDNDWQMVSSGDWHSLALKNDNTLWGWGRNSYGQLGDSTTNRQLYPVKINNTNWFSISAKNTQTTGLQMDGSLYAWGYNLHGYLGTGDTLDRWQPTHISCPYILRTPVFTSFSPTVAKTGNTVTIKGLYFLGTTSVKFGGVAASGFTVVNDSVITATVGAGATGSVSITTLGGSASKAGFIYCPQAVLSNNNFSGCGSVTYKSKIYTASTSFYDTILNRYGCDSVYAFINIYVSPLLIRDTTVTVCNSFTWHGVNYTKDTIVKYTFPNYVYNQVSEGFSGGITAPSGWTFTNITATYTTAGNYGASSPSLRFANTGAQVITSTYSNNATQLSFWLKTQGATTGCSLLVEGFNGTNWTTVDNITSFPTTGTVLTYNTSSTPQLPLNLNRFRFTYTKTAGNISLDDIVVNYAIPISCDSVIVLHLSTLQKNVITNTKNLSACKKIIYNSKVYTASTVLRDTIKTQQGCDSIYNIVNITINTNCVYYINTSFNVDITNYLFTGNTLDTGGIRIAGNFTDLGINAPNWSPLSPLCRMTKQGATNVYSITLAVPDTSVGKKIFFKFVNTNWGKNEGIDFGSELIMSTTCSVNDGANNYNRVLNLPANDSSVSYCWDRCGVCNKVAFAPGVVSGLVTSFTPTSITVTGNSLTATGGATVTRAGVLVSTDLNPNIYNTVFNAYTYITNPPSGNFDVTVTGLSANVKYYARAFASNEVGTKYGSVLTYTICNPAVKDTIIVTGCDSVIHKTKKYTVSVNISDTLKTLLGCDSLYRTYSIIVKKATTSTTNLSVCDSVVWNNTTYKTSGVYMFKTTNTVGCDSTATLNLTIKKATSSITNLSVCDSVIWNNTTYKASGTYTFKTTNAVGCDSIATLNLTIKAVTKTITQQDFFGCNSYVFNGKTYTSSTIIKDTLKTAFGCDSVYRTFNINIQNIVASSQNINVNGCGSYLYKNNTYYTTTLVKDTLRTTQGCDSVYLTVNIAVDPIVSGRIFTPNKSAIKNVQLNIFNSGLTTLNVNGSYASGCLNANNNVVLKPSKNNDIVKANGVTSIDVLLTLRHISNAGKLNSPYKIIAADVDGNKLVNSVDVLRMKRLILGSDTTFPSSIKGNRLWEFVDSAYTFPDTTNPFPFKDSISFTNLTSNKNNQTFIGIKLGDVNYDWNTAAARGTTANSLQLIANSEKQTTNNLQLSFTSSNFSNLAALQTTLHFDNTNYEFIGIENGKLQLDYNASKANKTGNIALLWTDKNAEAKSFDKDEVLFTVILKPRSVGISNLEFTVSNDMVETEAWDNNFAKRSIVLTRKLTNDKYQLANSLLIYPNPAHTTVDIKLDKLTVTATLVITDVYGKQVLKKVINQFTTTIDIAGFAKGVYMISVITEQGKETQKLVVE